MSDGPAPFETRYSLKRLSLLFAGSAIFVALSAWMIAFAGHGFMTIVGIAGAAFFGLCAIFYGRCLFDRRIQIRIDASGMVVRDHSPVPIRLRSIRRIRDQGGWLALILHKPGSFPPTTPMRRLVARLNGRSGREQLGDVWIHPFQYSCSKDDLLDAIAAHRPMTAFERDLAVRSGRMAPPDNDEPPYQA